MQNIVITEEQNYEVLQFIKDSVAFELGGPMVDVEIPDESIEKLVQRALTILSKYSLVVIWHTVALRTSEGTESSFARYVDTTDFPFKISYIVDILKSRGNNDALANTADIAGIPMGWALRSGRSSQTNYTDMIGSVSTLLNERALVSRLLGSFKDQCTYDLDKPRNRLWIDVGFPASSNITLEYIPRLTIDQIGILEYFPEAYDFITQYTIALSMISLGRARGKYAVGNYDWSISSADLVTSGQAKIEKLMEMVNTSYSRAMSD